VIDGGEGGEIGKRLKPLSILFGFIRIVSFYILLPRLNSHPSPGSDTIDRNNPSRSSKLAGNLLEEHEQI
jgi:hypothetical protein